MKRLICGLVIVAAMLALVSCGSGEKVRILFIGNSLTYMNDLPAVFAALAKHHKNVIYDSYAPGGYRLSQHAADPQLLEKIKKGGWDFVVLQEQSQVPAFSQEQVGRESYPYAAALCELIRKDSPNAQIAFYMTMARRDGDAENAKFFPEVATYAGMQSRINETYTEMARQNQGIVVPVGRVWQEMRSRRPEINIYFDEAHPNLTGTYLAACVFYATLFKASPVGLSHPEEIDNDTAAFIQKITEEICAVGKTPQ